MSFLYPRMVSITRMTATKALGAVGYNGSTPDTEQPIAAGLPAAIQLRGESRKPQANLPADAGAGTMWKILIPRASAQGVKIQNRDIVTDDAGIRYQVIGPYRTALLGLDLLAERLET